MKNSEIVYSIIDKLEKGHISLWHDIEKIAFLKIVERVNWDSLNQTQFDYEMLKLFHLFKDGHTRYFVKYVNMNHRMIYKDEKLYIKNNGIFMNVKSINGIDIAILSKKFEKMICYETDQWRQVQLQSAFNNKYFYEMIGIEENLYCLLEDNTRINFQVLTKAQIEKSRKDSKPYKYSILENNILYLQYSACIEDKKQPFSELVADIRRKIVSENIRSYILDIRGNGGGNSEILNPFQNLVRELNLTGVMLIDSKVFSSGRFAVARFKKEFNIVTIGTPTGGAAASYGYNNNASVEDKSFSYSIRYWDFTDIFNTRGPILPDIYIDNTIEDINNGYDRQLEYAKEQLLKIINKQDNTKK